MKQITIKKTEKNSIILPSYKYIFKNYGIIIVFFFLCLALFIATPNFIRSRNLLNVLRQISINGLLSLGMTFVILTGGIDLSVGSVLAFAGVIAASMASQTMGGVVYPLPIIIITTLLAGALLGAINGTCVAYLEMPAFVVTLGMLSVARGLTYIYSGGIPIPQLSSAFLAVGTGNFLGIPIPVLIFIFAFVLLYIFLYRTRYGRHIYAAGGNEKSAWVSGVNVKQVLFSVYVISGVLAALGGIILTARTTSGLPQAGQAYELDAIAAVVIGGTNLKGGKGQLLGTLFGVLIIGVINNGLNLLGVSSYYQQVVKGLIIMLAVLLDFLRNKAAR